MTPRLRRARRLGVLALVLALAAAGRAQQQWFELYDQAIEHVRRAEWEQAEARLRLSQQQGPPPGRAVRRYGMFRPPFFPDFYLGVVCLNTQRPTEALRHFALARAQKINEGDAEFRALAEYESQARVLEERLAKANAIAAPAPQTRTDVAPSELPRRERAELAPAQAPPPEPRAEVDAVVIERERQRDNAEREAMRLFFSGRYGESVAVLNQTERDLATRLTARGYFYRACAIAAQALGASRVNARLLEEARAQYAQAVREGQIPSADRRFVSPRILQALGL
jgi:hypothetical protein